MVETFAAGETALGISVISILELAHGITRSNSERLRIVRQTFLDDLLAGMPVVPVTIPIALRAGRLDGALRAQGVNVALADLLIGATALELG